MRIFWVFIDNEPDHNAFPESPIIHFWPDHTCKMQLMITPFSLGPNVVPFITKGEMPISYLFFGVSNLVEIPESINDIGQSYNATRRRLQFRATQTLGSDFPILQLSYLNKLRYLDKRITNLRQTRDLLLPKLISGEIDVSELDIGTD